MTTGSQTSSVDKPMPLDRSALKPGLWSTAIKIRFGHCDPAGIVYTPRFFDIFNVAIEEWYNARLGISYYDLIGPRRTGLGYVNAHADFFQPACMGDTLEIAVDLERVGTSSFALQLHAFNGEAEALRGRFTVVTTDLTTHRSKPIPDDLRVALLDYAKS
ncbi:acyl-CoA thioesterase [Tianweitania sp. BSSL-BM11]|uniref:Acyl-CoA thioesterase n=1 Tax=Tianweitania aestuarii TaxID=2814886 RepID=A0ABS5S1S8_9HYPH|nr:thioesterase family protein [Tianweitania aestuarii]MBS9721857.1 acyl-CoA thioesterase [Tianweitania aestuarii]